MPPYPMRANARRRRCWLPRRILAIDPRFWYAHISIGNCLRAKGRYAEALQEYRLLPKEDLDAATGNLGNALALAGQREEAKALLGKLLAEVNAADEGNGWVRVSWVQVGLADKAAALTSLENAYAHHETDANYIGVDPTPCATSRVFRRCRKNWGFKR